MLQTNSRRYFYYFINEKAHQGFFVLSEENQNAEIKGIRKENFENKRNLIIAQRNIKMIKNSLKDDFESVKNMNEYEKLQNEIEYSRQISM